MYRLVVSLLLLPCVLLTQSAAVFGRAHCGGQLAGYDLRTHVHTNSFVVNSHDAHRHGGHHHHRHDDLEHIPEPQTQPTSQPEPLSDHDSDAIDVNATDTVLIERSEPTTQVESSNLWSFLDLAQSATFNAALFTRPVVCGHPPPGRLCPLYIRHLTLLI